VGKWRPAPDPEEEESLPTETVESQSLRDRLWTPAERVLNLPIMHEPQRNFFDWVPALKDDLLICEKVHF
jgi:hypothetical protein